MKIACFYHSLISDWNHGNAHFLRGVVAELLSRGHEVRVYEPRDAWSVDNLLRDHGEQAIAAFHAAYPDLRSDRYGPDLDLDRVLDDVDLVLVHEWNEPELVARIGEHHATHRYVLLFHDTHHRSVTAPDEIERYDLSHYDGVLAFGGVIRDLYRERGWAPRAWTWHEAADVRTFKPLPDIAREGDLVWVGNWGDGERSTELQEMLIAPVVALKLRARVHGVRYPEEARDALAGAGITYAGWLPNFDVPAVFARYAVTVHVPRRPYVDALPGIPTIRMFEALACGIPLVSSPWHDTEGLFAAGEDYLVARDGDELRCFLRAILCDRDFAADLANHGRDTILARHTCAHRVDALLDIVKELS
ncbi:MAG: a-glycosyltransferase, Glycosyltransferase Family 4-like protein [Myxococcales bacterium]|nr:a-glycosyltransferase, Glycosyltransferase Family 4-like protein [Myxococcales bacterium]